MSDLPETAWIAIGLIIFAAAAAVLHALGAKVRNELELDALRLKAAELRKRYRKRLAEAEDRRVLDVGEEPDSPKAEPARLAA